MKPTLCFTMTIKGTVQGVGFRPFVYRIAKIHSIRGEVRNDSSGVTIKAFGDKKHLDAFIQSIKRSPPPLAHLKSIAIKETTVADIPGGFSIAQSDKGESAEIDIARDTAVCSACLEEMFDPANRRFHHPFINCTDCGPRYTIIKDLPYDRPKTTMAAFDMCDKCRQEYEDPADRRFHAQPICCHDCGPKCALTDSSRAIVNEDDPITAAIDLLLTGKIVAIKGIGGFHLACRADQSKVVATLRARKRREEKPFAIMVKDTQAALRYALLTPTEKAMLESPERPIVLLAKKDGAPGIAAEVAPGLPTLGIMLPYTPIHHLLFLDERVPALVMTSANFTDEPIIFSDADAAGALRGIADAFLTHDRPIHMRNDDSIVRVVADMPVILRRSRGFVPEPLPSPVDVTGLVALGGVLKSTIAVGRNNDCYLSHYIGTVDTAEALDSLVFATNHLTAALGVTPRSYVCDMHPQSLIGSHAESSGLPVVKVQHHHAHAAACLAENEITDGALAVVYDGTGFGEDGTIWGGEILHTTFTGYSRLGHLSYLTLPGGDEAIRNPGRIALAALHRLLGDKVESALPQMPHEEISAVLDMVKSNVNCVQSCGMGRLFDAASALLGICSKRTYEGQPAIMLEGVADSSETGSYGSPLSIEEKGIIIDGPALLCEAYEDLKNGTPVPKIAARFHTTIAQATAAAAAIAAQQCNCTNVCLSGGVFQNALLVTRLLPLLKQAGLMPVLHRRTPPNDECISYGQLVVAGAKSGRS
ncbi:MAG TPA: carbamoyltransferase HypF [Chitinivibrionales bacterium]|nr:carbamoyltransferase HypF [Chitinivibrionales bacterium]